MANPYAQPVDNLSAFTHPVFGQQFRYMDDREAVALARRVLDGFTGSGYDTVVAMESGTSPLLQIMRRFRSIGGCGLNLVQLKVPRDPQFNLPGWFETYLSEEELSGPVGIGGETTSRRQALTAACGRPVLQELVGTARPDIYDSIHDRQPYDSSLTEQFRRILAGTSLSAVLSRPFLLFDEYINSGTVLRNFNGLVRLFNEQPEFKVSAFCTFVDDAAKYDKIAFSLYDKQTELACYRDGAYPYENRIDIIGYTYFVTARAFEKVSLASLYDEITAGPHANPDAFYDCLLRTIHASGITERVKGALHEEQVRNYVTPYDVARFIVKQLEYATHGETKQWDVLDQAFELYAPAWSPMPVQNHLDYWNGFATVSGEAARLAEPLHAGYLAARSGIFHDLLKRFLATKSNWDARIDQLIQEKNL